MNQEEYIDHEVRIRLMESMYKQMNSKMNTLIAIAVTGLIVPMFLKYMGLN